MKVVFKHISGTELVLKKTDCFNGNHITSIFKFWRRYIGVSKNYLYTFLNKLVDRFY